MIIICIDAALKILAIAIAITVLFALPKFKFYINPIRHYKSQIV